MVVLVGAQLLVPQKIWRGKLESGEEPIRARNDGVLVQGGHKQLQYTSNLDGARVQRGRRMEEGKEEWMMGGESRRGKGLKEEDQEDETTRRRYKSNRENSLQLMDETPGADRLRRIQRLVV